MLSVVVYLAVVQGSVSAGQWLSFGPSKSTYSKKALLSLTNWTDIAQASAAANRIRSMRSRGEVESKEKELDLSSLDDEEKGPQGVKIELKNIWFQYPTRDVPVLTGLNLTVSLAEPETTSQS